MFARCVTNRSAVSATVILVARMGTASRPLVGCGTSRRSPPPDADVLAKWSLWEKLQENGEVAYQSHPDHSLSIGVNEVEREFGRFCRFEGRVLDVGCGPQAFPSYAKGFTGDFVGIDPLDGVQPRLFGFVKGIGEYLPFADETFTRVVFATSLDHVLSPGRVLAEARRVVSRSGEVCIWFGDGEHDQAPPSGLSAQLRKAGLVLKSGGVLPLLRIVLAKLGLRVDSNAWKSSLQIPDGAVDHFHFYHLTRPQLVEWLRDVGLDVVETQQSNDQESIFVRARRATVPPS